MILFTVSIALFCLFVVISFSLPDLFAWEDRMLLALVGTTGVAVTGVLCGGLWLIFCASINWTIQNILT